MTTDKPRRKLTAADRAQEAFDVASRKVDRLTAKRDALQARKLALREKYETEAAAIDSDVNALDYDIDDATREQKAYRQLVNDLTPGQSTSPDDARAVGGSLVRNPDPS